jgi:hypothetical protein
MHDSSNHPLPSTQENAGCVVGGGGRGWLQPLHRGDGLFSAQIQVRGWFSKDIFSFNGYRSALTPPTRRNHETSHFFFYQIKHFASYPVLSFWDTVLHSFLCILKCLKQTISVKRQITVIDVIDYCLFMWNLVKIIPVFPGISIILTLQSLSLCFIYS